MTVRPLRDLLLLALALAVSAVAIGRYVEAPEVTEDARRRWVAMGETERARLRLRYEEFSRLDPAMKERLNRRARRLDELARRIYRALEDGARARLDGLGEAKRREILREMAAAEARAKGRRILERLAPEERRRLEGATEEERQAFFLEFAELQARRLDRAIERLGPTYFSETELERLRAIGAARERREAFLRIVKWRAVSWMERHVEERGLPEGLSEERWRSMRELAPPDFWTAYERARRELDLPSPLERSEERPAAPRLLRRAMMVDVERRVRLSALEPDERRRRLRELRRQRVLDVVEKHELLVGEDLERLRAATDEVFFDWVEERAMGFREAEVPEAPDGR